MSGNGKPNSSLDDCGCTDEKGCCKSNLTSAFVLTLLAMIKHRRELPGIYKGMRSSVHAKVDE